MIVHVYFSYLSDAGRTVMCSNIGGKAIFCCIYIVIAAYPQLTVSDIDTFPTYKPSCLTILSLTRVQNGLDLPTPVLKWAGLVL